MGGMPYACAVLSAKARTLAAVCSWDGVSVTQPPARTESSSRAGTTRAIDHAAR